MLQPLHAQNPLFAQQQALGNQAVQRMLRSAIPQAKLTIGQPGDKYEQEADRVAEQVMRMPEPPSAEGETAFGQRQPVRIQRVCPECDGELRRQPVEEEEEEEEEEEILRAKAAPGRTPEVTPDVQAGLSAMRGGGQPLPEAARAFFEPRFGYDFSHVRVHTDSTAAQMAADLNAQAFAVGPDVVLGAGQYAPSTAEGRRLLAHELAHVLQQNKLNSNQKEGSVIQRRVRPGFVSCQAYPRSYPIFAAIGTIDPVGTIQAADTRAIQLLDTAIDELEGTRNRILGGAPIGWPTISDATALGLRNRFRMDPDSRRVWTGRGAGTVDVLIQRYRAVREILNGGWLRYTCLAPATITTPTCSGPCCGGEARACSCEGVYRIFLCRPWWTDRPDDQAATLLHEGFHIYFGFISDTGHLGNAHCYEQFVYHLNALTVPPRFVGACP